MRGFPGDTHTMSQMLPVEQARELLDWLADCLKDEAEVNPEFVASIRRGPTS